VGTCSSLTGACRGRPLRSGRISNIAHVSGHARSPCVPTERPRRQDRRGRAGGILHIGTEIVGPLWGSVKGAARAHGERVAIRRSASATERIVNISTWATGGRLPDGPPVP